MNTFSVVLYITVGTFIIYILSLEKRLKALKAEALILKKYVKRQQLQLDYRESELKVQKKNLRKENKLTLSRAKPVEINYLINSLSVPSSNSELYTFLDYAERLLDTYDKTVT